MTYRPPRNIFILGLTSLFNDFSSEMVLSVFPAFFVSVLKAGAGSLGLVEGIAEGAANLIKVYAGRLSDAARKRKPFMLLGYALSVATRPLYLLVSSVAGVIGLRFADRVGKGLRDAPRDAIISLSTPKEELGRAFGYHRAFDTLGAISGPLVAYLILRAHPQGFHIIFLSAFAMGILAVVSLLFVTEVMGDIKKNITLPSLSTFSGVFKRYLVALFFLSLGSIPVAVLLLKTRNIGVALASIPLFYTLYNLSYAGFSFSAGKMSDRFGAKNIIILGYLLLVCSYIFLSFADTALTLGMGFLVLGFFPALTDGVQRALASELSAEGERGSALGFVNAVAGIGLLFAGIGGGWVWEHVGANYAFAIASISVLCGIALLLSVGSPSCAPDTARSR
jgi:MFS family permease